MATVLDNAVRESSRLQRPEGLRNHSAHSAPPSRKPQSLGNLGEPLRVPPACRGMFTPIQPLKSRVLSALACQGLQGPLRPPAAACARRPRRCARSSALPRRRRRRPRGAGGGGAPGAEDAARRLHAPGAAGRSLGGTLAELCRVGRTGRAPPVRRGADMAVLPVGSEPGRLGDAATW